MPCRISNQYAPEHLILQVAEPRDLLPGIRNAGSIFLGPWTPESVGDYCSGTNHVLPTYGYAQTYSGLGVDQFMRQMTVQELSREGLENLGAAVVTPGRTRGPGCTCRCRHPSPGERTMSIVELARPEIRSLHAYDAARTGRRHDSPQRQRVAATLLDRQFPAPAQSLSGSAPAETAAALAQRFGCEPDELLVTRGSSEAIDLVIRTFCRAGHRTAC